MTRDEFAPVVAYLSAAVGKVMPTDQAEVYFDLLQDLPAPLVARAVKRAVAESRYPTVPPVGTIRAVAAELAGGSAPTWPEAWAAVCLAARRYGLHRREQALDSLSPAVARAALAIGWQALCDAGPGDLDTLRAQFRDAYNALGARDEREQRLPGPLRAARLTEGIGMLPAPEGEGWRRAVSRASIAA
jgi:hypothetical protein